MFAAEAERLLTSSRVSTVLGGFSSASRRGTLCVAGQPEILAVALGLRVRTHALSRGLAAAMRPVFERRGGLLLYPAAYEGGECRYCARSLLLLDSELGRADWRLIPFSCSNPRLRLALALWTSTGSNGCLLFWLDSRNIVYGGAVPDTLLRPALKWLFRLRAELRWFLVGDAANFNGACMSLLCCRLSLLDDVSACESVPV